MGTSKGTQFKSTHLTTSDSLNGSSESSKLFRNCFGSRRPHISSMRQSMQFFQRPLSAGLVLAVMTFVAGQTHAQRLPQTVHPEHYQLTLTPDLKDATFTGSEKIEVVLGQPS